jgi:DNA-binding SARP family transcriptional activator/TolB-like protein
MAILALLARVGQRGMARDKVLTLLWPDAEDDRGSKALAQAIYALRKDLGADEVITGITELRLDPSHVSSDVGEFAAAVSRGDDDRAVELYTGPFLDGFHLPNANDFARWVEVERAALAADHLRSLESVARRHRAAGEVRESVTAWRKLAALEPLNARVAVGLMDALAASGDRAGAIKHARIYEALIEQELDLPPDAEVVTFADRLRREAEAPLAIPEAPPPAPATAQSMVAPSIVVPSIVAPSPQPVAVPVATPVASMLGPSRHSWAWAAVVLAVLGGGAFATRTLWSGGAAPAPGDGRAVIAIGHVAAFGADSAQNSLAAPVADLLTTSLARVHGIRVVSHGRMLELMRTLGNEKSDTSGFIEAARRAGATEVVDGTLFTRPDGQLRLDLRRVDLVNGAIGDVTTIEGKDLFALVDSGTARLVTALGTDAPTGSVADVSTRSVTAYRMYEQGIRAFYRGDPHTALGFFDAALGEDSLFALAAYYGALSDQSIAYLSRMDRARRLATRATDRERLTILAGWAYSVSSPTLSALADTLATRYPTETEGHLYSGIARVYDGDFLGALAPLERVLMMDSLGVRDGKGCSACEALLWKVSAYDLADSLAASEREARRWMRLQPNSRSPRFALWGLLAREGRTTQADTLVRVRLEQDLSHEDIAQLRASALLLAADYNAADKMLSGEVGHVDVYRQAETYWLLGVSLREQGRLSAALDAAQHSRVDRAFQGHIGTDRTELEAQILLESGRIAEARALFDSLAWASNRGQTPSQIARNKTWMLAQTAGPRRALGDTTSLARLADSLQMLSAQSGYGRDRRLHHYVRGLLLASRGDDAGAIAELKASIYSVNLGYTRANYELAQIYLRDKRPRDAIAILQPVLRGTLEASNLYLNRADVHELLAQAWDAAGVRDSAAAHLAWLVRAWANADPWLAGRANAARLKLATLRR